jgi:hypothetical protein
MNKLDKIDEMHAINNAHEVKPFIIEEISDIVTEDINYKTSQTDPIYTTNIEKIIIGYESSYESSESFDSFTSLDSFTSTENTPTNVITNLQKNIIKEDEDFYGSTRHNRTSCAYIITVLTLLLVVINIVIYYFKS